MRKEIKKATDAHTNLNLFAAIVALLEGGLLYGEENKSAKQIIAICKKEQQRQLVKYDAAIASIQSDTAQGGKP